MIPFFQIQTIPIGPITIQIWGLMVALGILFGMLFSVREARRRGLKGTEMVDLTFWCIVAAMLGARIAFIVGHWSYYANDLLDVFKFWEGGMAISGGFIGAIIAGWIVLKVRRLPFWPYADVGFFALPLGLAIGRIGCFLIFDHPGVETSSFFGQEYLDGLVRHNHGLYLILLGAVEFALFLVLRAMRPNRFTGFYMGWWLILDSIGRFMLDFWRSYDLASSDPRFFGLTLAQYVSIAFFLFGVVVLWQRSKANQQPASPLHFGKHFQ